MPMKNQPNDFQETRSPKRPPTSFQKWWYENYRKYFRNFKLVLFIAFLLPTMNYFLLQKKKSYLCKDRNKREIVQFIPHFFSLKGICHVDEKLTFKENYGKKYSIDRCEKILISYKKRGNCIIYDK